MTDLKKPKSGRKPKTIYEFFQDFSEDEVNNAILKLNYNYQELLEKAYGRDLKDKTLFRNLTNNEKAKIAYIRKKISDQLAKPQTKKSNKKIKQKEHKKREKQYEEELTSNPSADLIKRTKYKKLSRSKEIEMIKKAKLSYYYDVDETLKEKYLEYYLEMYPGIKKRFEKIDYLISKIKQTLEDEYTNLKDKEKIDQLKKLSHELKQLIEIRNILLEKCIENSKIHRDKFLANNIKLVASTIRHAKYRNKALFEDLFIEGNIGLIKALKLFDVEKGNKFSTYAMWWIIKTVERYIQKHERTIRLPSYIEEMLSKVNWAIEEIEKEGFTATPETISKKTEIELSKVKKVLEIRRQFTLVTSLNIIANRDEKTELENFIPIDDFDYDIVDDKIYRYQFLKKLKETNLISKIVYILIQRNGLVDDIPKSIEEVSEELGIPKVKVRQLEKRGLEYLRDNKELIKFFNNEEKNKLK